MKKKILNIIKYVIVVLSVCVVAFLFIFQGDISAYFEELKGADISISADEDLGSSYIATPAEDLEYDGTGEIDYMDGVTATDTDGTDITDEITFTVIAGDVFNEKTVRYSVFNSNYQLITKDRTLILTNYEGPSITMDTDVDFDEYDLSSIVDDLAEDGILSATDGYGGDITDDIVFSYTLINSNSSLYQVVFSVNNEYGDTDSVSFNTTITADDDVPTVTLKQSSVTISAGSDFDPMEYVDSAVDGNGEDLSDLVLVEGNINLSKTGQYTLTYSVTNSSGQTSPSVSLIVYVR